MKGAINKILILANKEELFKKILGLSPGQKRRIFQKKDLEKIKNWAERNQEKILKAYNFNPFWRKNTLFLYKGENLNPLRLLRELEGLNYEKVQRVLAGGEYAHRGEIIDIFPINTKEPIRLEFLGHELERIYLLKADSWQKEAEEYQQKITLSQEAFLSLTPGDYIVHLDHGIGRFQGILIKAKKKYYQLEYAAKDILLVPLGLEKKLSPYIGFIEPKIHRLGGSLWHKTKKRVKQDLIKFAKDLLSLYVKRELSSRPPYPADDEMQKQIEDDFAFELTADQRKTLMEIKKDLTLNTRPMDRLICGDVGFGKTEIALRTAVKVASAGKQVALISPTTILADQHYHTFLERLEKYPLRVALLSRILSSGEQRKVLREVSEGKVDILIGTHRILSRDVIFKNLGLLIIDEEQRFGVSQKEKLKKARHNIDILSLSATPIPRTLHMALSQLKDISLILTPPPNKKAVQTLILPFSPKVIKKAIFDELRRGGQIYYLHNRIGTMEATQEKLKKILPGVKIRYIHGRMKEKAIIKTIHDFREKKFGVLIATTIIENGLDFSNVNTLIVEDATRLGLAQAHQIRGRVGRAEKKARAYFLYPSFLSQDAKERLASLKKFSYLGAGYQVALKDLEIRGAGNILGPEQSGAINKVGLNLYYQMLSQAIEEVKKGD